MRQLFTLLIINFLLLSSSCFAMQTAMHLSNEMRALVYAIKMAGDDEVGECLDSVENVNQVIDEHGNTPLHWAVYVERADKVDRLLRRNASAVFLNNNLCSPLDAARKPNPEYVRFHTGPINNDNGKMRLFIVNQLMKTTCEK